MDSLSVFVLVVLISTTSVAMQQLESSVVDYDSTTNATNNQYREERDTEMGPNCDDAEAESLIVDRLMHGYKKQVDSTYKTTHIHTYMYCIR